MKPSEEAAARSGESRLEWLERITRETAEPLKVLPPSYKIGDLLFDEKTGLPK